MLKTFKIGGVHPPENKLSAQGEIITLPLPEQVSIPLSQHIGAPAVPTVQNTVPAAPAPAPEKEGKEVTAPLVGTFYVAPAPGEEPFAPVGKHLKKGDTLVLAGSIPASMPEDSYSRILEMLKDRGVLFENSKENK